VEAPPIPNVTVQVTVEEANALHTVKDVPSRVAVPLVPMEESVVIPNPHTVEDHTLVKREANAVAKNQERKRRLARFLRLKGMKVRKLMLQLK